MNKLFVSILIMFSGPAALASEARILGNVVAEERTFSVEFEDCLKTFKKGTYASVCKHIDSSVKSPDTDLVIGDLPFIGEKIPNVGSEGFTDVTLSGLKNGWQAVFSVDTDISSRSMSVEEAKSYFSRLREKVNGQVKVRVYTIK
jgi:hypothetical protein